MHPGAWMTLDESMIFFEGTSELRQYNPKKPVKFEMKVNDLADAETGYMLNWHVYLGNGSKTTHDIVLEFWWIHTRIKNLATYCILTISTHLFSLKPQWKKS